MSRHRCNYVSLLTWVPFYPVENKLFHHRIFLRLDKCLAPGPCNVLEKGAFLWVYEVCIILVRTWTLWAMHNAGLFCFVLNKLVDPWAEFSIFFLFLCWFLQLTSILTTITSILGGSWKHILLPSLLNLCYPPNAERSGSYILVVGLGVVS